MKYIGYHPGSYSLGGSRNGVLVRCQILRNTPNCCCPILWLSLELILCCQPEDDRWCEILERGRPLIRKDSFKRNARMRTMCYEPLALISDGQFHEFWSATTPRSPEDDNMKLHYKNFSPIYASLPVHRVTVLRELFSWLLSKDFWHKPVDW